MSDLNNKIQEWLSKHGYLLEMRVAERFNELGFDVKQADYYLDNETSAYRELDIVASISMESDEVYYAVNCLIECKVCKKNPWLVFKNPSTDNWNHKLIMFPGNELGEKMAFKYMFDKDIIELPVLSKTDSIGYLLVETLRGAEKKDNSYSSMMSISKALSSYSKNPLYSHVASKNVCEIFLPIVVIDGELFEGHLNAEKNLSLTQTNHSAVLWNNPICGNRATIVNIVCFDYLEEFCFELKNSSYSLLEKIISDGVIETLASR